MAKIGVSLSIDVTKIDKARIFEGKKGKYLSIYTVIDIDQKDQYDNNGMVTQSVEKAEKDAGIKGNILGNCKVLWGDSEQQAPTGTPRDMPGQAPQQAPPQEMDDFSDNIPF